MKHTHRKIISFIAIIALLFTQLAVSAYACPMLNGGVTAQMQMADNADTTCDEMDMAQPGLCQHHCLDGQQINNDSPLDPSALAFIPAFVVSLTVSVTTTFETTIVAAPSLHHATSPPLSIRNCCFRI